MFKLILIAGGAIAMATAPAHAGGKPSLTRQALQCLGCPGAGAAGAPIVAGNLNVSAKAQVAAPGLVRGNVLNVRAHANAGARGLDVAAKAKANLPSPRLGNCLCN